MLPPGYKQHSCYHQSGEDCQAQPYSHWTSDVRQPDGRVILGYGLTAEQAKQESEKKAWEHYKFMQKPGRDRLKAYIASVKSDHCRSFYPYEMLDIIEILSGSLPE
jgi:hypothetical protein